MATICVQRDPASITGIEKTVIDGQVNLLDWLCKNEPDNFDGLHCSCVFNGKELFNTWDFTPEECNNFADVEMGHFDKVLFVLRPAGIDPGTLAIISIVVGIASAAVAIALAPKPVIPSNLEDGGASSQSNNQLNAAKNAYRPREAIPDIAGRVVSYPDFAQLSYYEYQNNERVFREIFVIGVGRYFVTDVKIGDDLINDIDGSDFTYREDGDTPPNLLNVRPNANSQEVDLTPPDGIQKTSTVDGIGSASGSTLFLTEDIVSGVDAQVGDSITVELSYDGGNISVVGTVDSLTSDSITFAASYGWANGPMSGYITNETAVPPEVWYTLEGDAIEEVWLDLKAPGGIKDSSGDFASITITLTIEELDTFGNPTGTTYQRGCVMAGNTRNPLFQTFKLTQADGIGIGRFRAKVRRVTFGLGANAIDTITMESVKAVTPYTADFGDVATLDVTRRSSGRVSQGQSEKINALVTRRLRKYIPGTGYSGYSTTRDMYDYVIYLLNDRMGVPIENIDTQGLIDIQNGLSDARLGYFDGTFDDKNISARDRLEIVLNNCRVRYWNQGVNWFFVREEAKPISTMMFNRRNLKGGSYQFTQTFRRPSDYDGVTIVYVDPDKNADARVYRRINSSGNIVNEQAINPQVFDMKLGCRNSTQAENRADLEVRRLIYQGVSVTDTALNDALELQMGERVDHIDIYDTDFFDGEILEVNGNVYTTSERFEPEDGVTYYVYITDDNGDVSNSVIATARSDGNIFGFEASGLSGEFLSDGVIQCGSRYVIASNDDLESTSYFAISRGAPNELGECEIELAEYNELMFEED